jgi:PAS domain S-box-containing protein
MNYHKLLNRQISKYLSAELADNPAVKKFLSVIDDSYEALQRDKMLVERAFSISEEEYIEINKKLKHEVEVKKKSIERLKRTLGEIGGSHHDEDPDDLLAITEYLNQQVIQRKSAEKVFTSLVNNSQSGILLEDENRKIVFTNQLFCDLFNMAAPAENLTGIDCSQSAQQSKHLFKDPQEFVADIDRILENKSFVTDNLNLADGRILRREYIPIFIDDIYRGHLWSYTDITEKKKAQEALEQSELKNRLIMNSALDAIITIDHRGLITFWNPQAEKIFGWKEAEVLGKRLSDNIIPSYHKKGHEKGMDHYNRTGKGPVLNKMIELPAVNIKGEEFQIELSIIPVKQGDTEFFCSFIRDISDRKKNEEALKASQELWQFALEGAGDGVWEYNFQTKEVFFSKQYKSMLGYQDDEFLNDSNEWLKRVHPEDIPLIELTDKAYFSGEINSHQREYRILHKNEHYIWVLDRGMLVNRTPEGLPERIIGTHSDITDRKLSEQALSIKEEKYRSIITNMNLGLIEVDNDEYIQFANQTFCKMSGFNEEDLINAKATELLALGENKNLIESKNELRKNGISDAYQVSVRNKDGELRWWLISGAPRLNDKGEHVGSIGIHLDITAQKELEHELIKAKEAAEASTEAKEAFLANMSHEIRTPMNAISGMANQLIKTKLDPNQQFFLNTIRSASDNLLVIINDILDLSKIESGKLGIEKIGFEPKRVIGHVMEVMQHRAEEKGLKFTNSFCDQQLSDVLIGDPYRLSQIMLNLVSNAIKFTPKGRVDISCSVLQDMESEQIIEVMVQDTGVGMETEFIAKLFEKFSQEDNSVTRKYGGTGLGMSICKKLVELMDGKISVVSEKNKGTTVSFILRLLKGSMEDLPEKTDMEVDTTLLNGKKILITDDNEINRLLASTILLNFGAHITEASNGEEAIERLKTENYDLILMDVQMPVMDGLEATQLIRKNTKDRIPIIALTAFALKGDNQKCFDAGMDDYLSKPFEEIQLLEVVSRWLGKSINFETEHREGTSFKESLYDLSQIEDIARGNQDFVKKMITLFAEQLPISLKDLNDAYAAQDFERMSKIAHRIKPSIDNMGILSLKDEVREIEKFAKEYGQSDRLESLLKNLNEILNQVIYSLKENI